MGISAMIATKRTFLKTFFLISIAIITSVFSLSCETPVTGPSVTQEELRRETQKLQAENRVHRIEKREPSFIFKSPAQEEAMVKSVGSKVLKQVGEPVKIDFEIQESRDVNAGATVRKIVVTTGMMRFLKSDDELAVVLGHEIAHIVKGHIEKSIISNIPVIIGSQMAESAMPGSGKIVEMGGSIFTQKFSRDMEREADYFGIQYAYKAGYDVMAGVKIWERFAIELPESQRAGIFSSHPSSTERLVRAEKIAESLEERSRPK